jgi:hypothetical protein
MLMGLRGIKLHVLNLDTRRSHVISFMLRSLQLMRKTSVLIGMEISGHPRHCGCCRRERKIFNPSCLKLDSTRRSTNLYTGASNTANNSVAIQQAINLRTQEHRRYCHCKLITTTQHKHDFNYLISAITPVLMSTFKTQDCIQERN